MAWPARPRSPVTTITSPGRAPVRRRMRSFRTRPNAVPAIEIASASFVSPPSTAMPNSRTHSSMPCARPRRNSTSVEAGIDSAATKPRGRAPAAAMSLRLTAVAYQPICWGVAPGGMCVFACTTSVVTTR